MKEIRFILVFSYISANIHYYFGKAILYSESVIARVMRATSQTETIVLDEVPAGSDLSYYRDEDGVHHVPKIRVDDLLL